MCIVTMQPTSLQLWTEYADAVELMVAARLAELREEAESYRPRGASAPSLEDMDAEA
jgi:hypothetical protein